MDYTPEDVADLLNEGDDDKKEPKQLTDKDVKKIFPMFVDDALPDDHKCGSCQFRIGNSGCAIVEGKISMPNGTCAYWAKGPATTEDKIHEARMSFEQSGYVEAPSGMKINCETCRAYKDNYCKLWMAKVKPGQCCMAYDSDKVKQP